METWQKRLEATRGRPWDVIGVGECSLDEVWVLPGPLTAGSKVRASARERLGGGQVATALVAAARLGLRTAFAGAVGDDSAGRQLLDGLAQEGVAIEPAQVVAGLTRAAVILVDASGERTIVELRDGHMAPQHGPLAPSLFERARVVHLDAVHPGVTLHAARAAREAGALVSLDLDHAAPGLDELMALADVCITSAGLPQLLSGQEDLEQALRAVAAAAWSDREALLGCTLGPQGAAALDAGHLVLSPAFTVPQVVDTTACGDTFRAGLLRALLDENPVGEALRFANATAALKCRALGRRGCPTKAEVDELVARV